MRRSHLLALLLTPALASANDSSFHGSGSSVTSKPEPRVRMVSEDISIRENRLPETHPIYAAAPAEWSRPKLTYMNDLEATCEFLFENLTNEPVEVLMGFPDTLEGNDEGQWPEMWRLADFHARVEGREVETKHVRVDWEQPRDEYGMTVFYHAWTWPVRFKPRERLRILNTYRFGGSSSVAGLGACAPDAVGGGARIPVKAYWYMATKPPCGNDPSDGTCKGLTYIVSTGLVWAGPIGRADIRMEIPPGHLPSHLLPMPEATSISGTEVRWLFEDWEPSSEVALLVVGGRNVGHGDAAQEAACPLGTGHDGPGFHSVEQARAWVDWARRNGIDRWHASSATRSMPSMAGASAIRGSVTASRR